MKILILTKNILAEIDLQKKLLQLGHETFCSRDILDHFIHHKTTFGIQMFPLVILSESIPNAEVESLAPLLKESGKVVLRKSEALLEDEVEKYLPNCELDGWIFNNITKDSLRELLVEFEQLESYFDHQDELDQAMFKIRIEYFKISLTENERKAFEKMYSSLGHIVSPEEISKVLWTENVIANNISSIRNVIRSLRRKLILTDVVNFHISTKRGKGYVMTL